MNGRLAVAVVAVWTAALAPGCELSDSASRRALVSAGYSGFELGGASTLGCGGGESFSRTFRGLNPRGTIVEGIVCCGFLAGCVVRF